MFLWSATVFSPWMTANVCATMYTSNCLWYSVYQQLCVSLCIPANGFETLYFSNYVCPLIYNKSVCLLYISNCVCHSVYQQFGVFFPIKGTVCVPLYIGKCVSNLYRELCLSLSISKICVSLYVLAIVYVSFYMLSLLCVLLYNSNFVYHSIYQQVCMSFGIS